MTTMGNIKLTTTTMTEKEEEEEDEASNGIRVHQRRRGPTMSKRVHLYVNRSSRFNVECVNADRCLYVAEFTLRHKEKHILMTDAVPSLYRAVFNDDLEDHSSDAILKIDANHAPLQKAYQVQVKCRHTVVTVDADTKLSHLIDLSCLDVEQIVLTNQQMIRLLTVPS
jgi:hypothetical protein